MKTLICESMQFVPGEDLNPGDRTVKQVIIKTGQSLNGRHYSPEVLRKAAPLFENIQTYANHQTEREAREMPERNITDITGWLSDVHFDEEMEAIVGTRHFAETSRGNDVMALVNAVVDGEAPENLIGASISATGEYKKRDDGIHEVTRFTDVLSVDDVTTPGAGGGFQKISEAATAPGKTLIGVLMESASYEEWRKSRPDYEERLRGEMKRARQTDAIKELKETVKTLEDEKAHLHEVAKTARDESSRARYQLHVAEALNAVRIPAEWRESLRESLLNADDIDEDGISKIIDAEVAKLRRITESPSKRAVKETPSRTHTLKTGPTAGNRAIALPRPNEDYRTYQKRIARR